MPLTLLPKEIEEALCTALTRARVFGGVGERLRDLFVSQQEELEKIRKERDDLFVELNMTRATLNQKEIQRSAREREKDCAVEALVETLRSGGTIISGGFYSHKMNPIQGKQPVVFCVGRVGSLDVGVELANAREAVAELLKRAS